MLEKGWRVLILSDRTLVEQARSLIRSRVQTLENFHLRCPDDILPLQHELSLELTSAGIVRKIIEADLAFFTKLLGNDLHIQKAPYLRIARPGRKSDNVGLHRDIWYGSSPHELNVSIALTPTDQAGALQVVSGSHTKPADFYPTTSTESQHQKHSVGHKLGFLYAPKKLAVQVDAIPVPLRLGEALVFHSSTIHGQEVNASDTTRFSVDVRLVNSHAPVEWERGSYKDYFEPLTGSSVCSPSL